MQVIFAFFYLKAHQTSTTTLPFFIGLALFLTRKSGHHIQEFQA